MGFHLPPLSYCLSVSLVILSIFSISGVTGEPYSHDGRCPYPCCQARPYAPICAQNLRTFANICFLELYNRHHDEQFVGFKHDGPCYEMGHPDYHNQFYPEQQEHYGLHHASYRPEEDDEDEGGPPSYGGSYNNNFNHYGGGYGHPSPPANYYPIPPPSSNTSQSNMTTNNSTYNYNDTENDYYGQASSYNNYYPPSSSPGQPCFSGTGYPPYGQMPCPPPGNETTPVPTTPPPIPTGPPSNISSGETRALDPGSQFVIESPNFSERSNYPPNIVNEYLFLGTAGCLPLLSCSFFDLVSSKDCFTDYLAVSDNKGAIQRFCGTNGPQNVGTGWSIMHLLFHSGSSGASGFRCTVSCAGTNQQINVIPNAGGHPATLNTCTCGLPGNETGGAGTGARVVGGVDAQPNFWKWMAAVVFSPEATVPDCGGTLVNDRYVLTAAHCCNKTSTNPFVILNEFDTSQGSDTDVIRVAVSAVIIHPLYNPTNEDFDVCLLQLANHVNIMATTEPIVTPVCLPHYGEKEQINDLTITILGWGFTQQGGSQSAILQRGELTVIPSQSCDPMVGNVHSVSPRQFCAKPDTGVDACTGDSGGPAMLSNVAGGQVQIVQVGVISFGNGCARPNSPGVYSSLLDLVDWVTMVSFNGIWCQN